MKGIFSGVLIGGALAVSISVMAQNGLIISEVTDPADDYNGRFIELYNAGNEVFDFSTFVYFLSRQSNGGTSWGDVQLSGSVDPGDVYVIGGTGFEALYGFLPDLVTGILIGNGDDAYCLFRAGDHVSGELHDIYGEIDTDGTGTLWEYTDSRAVRVDSILSANTTWTAAEWKITPANLADCDPGSHAGSGGSDTIPSTGYALTVPDTVINGIRPVNIPVQVSALAAGDQIISYQFDLAFDPAVLDYMGYSLSGSIAEGGTLEVNTGNPGKLSIGYMNTSAIIGKGPILFLQFNAHVLDTSSLVLSDAWLNNMPVQQLTQGRVIIAEAEPPTVAINYSDSLNRFADTLIITATFSEPMDPDVETRFDLSGAATIDSVVMNRLNDTTYNYFFPVPKAEGEVMVRLSSGADLSGNQVLPVPLKGGSFTIMAFRAGDVDDDGLILAYDAALTLQYSVGLDPLPQVDPMPWEAWRDSTANVDGTGTITAYDAGLILQYAAGIITDFLIDENKGAGLADVIIKVEDHNAVFYADGELIGLNIDITEADGIPGMPVVLDDNFISAININGSSYRIGLCTGISPEESDPFMKIPLNACSFVTFSMMINNSRSEVTVDESTTINESGSGRIGVYPNPVTDRFRVSGLVKPCIASVFSMDGVLLYKLEIKGSEEYMDFSGLRSGVYILIVEDDEELVSRKVVKQ